jgi:hypothetical protein
MLDITEFDKDQLAEYAKTVFNVELDLRKSLVKLKEEIVKLQEKPKAEPVTAVAPQGKKATHILNRDTGMWFPYTELLYKHLTNAVPCDKDGNPV